MKEGGYRSFANYVSRVKESHIQVGYEWSEQHAQEGEAGHKVRHQRTGAGRQSAPLSVEDLLSFGCEGHHRQERSESNHAQGLFNANQAIFIGIVYLLREIELTNAQRSRVLVDEHDRRVTLLLPVSKTDRCKRRWVQEVLVLRMHERQLAAQRGLRVLLPQGPSIYHRQLGSETPNRGLQNA